MSAPARGAFTFVLHSHLPWVLNHGRWPHGVDWLNEATAETYLPLWRALHARAGTGRALGVTLGLTPVLCEQLSHPHFHREFTSYLEQKMSAAREDHHTFTHAGDGGMAALASRWERFYRQTLEDFMGPHGPNLVARFRRLEEAGAIEIITCGATHGYLPLLSSDVAAEAQIRMACAAHRRHFGRAPRGIWLPECAYRPAGPWPSPAIDALGGFAPEAPAVRPRAGVEELLERHGLRYFFVDSHLLLGGKPLGVYADRFDVIRKLTSLDGAEARGTGRAPYRAYGVGGESKVACFGRDPVTALQVWSGDHGYPGDGVYLDFHKKRFPGGHRYWSVTHPRADLAHKGPYEPERADARAPEHAAHFVSMLERTLADARSAVDGTPIVTAMFDGELFGHWWFEGPAFLAAVLDGCAASPEIEPESAGRFLDRQPPRDMVALPEGSWGDGGSHRVWLNDDTRWAWASIHAAEARFEALACEAMIAPRDALLERLLAQAGRELLLLEASDWPFLITTIAARDYAEARIVQHAADFDRLASLASRRLSGGSLTEGDEFVLSEIESRDALFPDFDWRWYAGSAAVVGTGG